MILVDTNVVSELMRTEPEPAVVAWTRKQPSGTLYFSSLNEAELRYGAAILPQGRRRERLLANIEAMLGSVFGDRVLTFDRAAALAYGHVAALRHAAARHLDPVDCLIAAIAHSHGLAVATRNLSDFECMEVELVDPWIPP